MVPELRHWDPVRAEADTRPRVLVVDDASVLRNVLREELEAEGFEVHLAATGEEGLQRARDERPDAILLDAVLPGIEGTEVCRLLKADPDLVHIPVIMVSSRNELKDKIAGFEAGADDYVPKPFFTKELVARLRSRVRTKEGIDGLRRLGQSYLEMLFGIGSAITSPFKLDDELEIILRQAVISVRAARGSILLLDRGRGTLVVRGVLGYEGMPDAPRIGDEYRISDKLPVLDLEDPKAASAISIHEDQRTNSAFVPMVAKETLIGGIEIALPGRGARFRANDQKILYALASQAAIVIENARLERDVRSMFLNIIVSMAGAVDAKDAYTHGHSLRVARVALLVGQQRGLERSELEPLLLSAILHDVGKIAIPDQILKKPGKLNKREFEIMKTHTTAGARMLQHIPALKDVIPGILEHHEFWNGSGYPNGLKGEEISLAGRIIHIGDTFDAMTTDRIYRTKVTVQDALAEIRKFSGVQFDPACVKHLEEAHRQGRIPDDLPESTPSLQELIEQIQ